MDAAALAPRREAEPERLALWGALHLTALFGAARGKDRRAADQLLNEAERAAERLGDDRNDFWFAFGPDQRAHPRRLPAGRAGRPR
jgi:hypothetical protein